MKPKARLRASFDALWRNPGLSPPVRAAPDYASLHPGYRCWNCSRCRPRDCNLCRRRIEALAYDCPDPLGHCRLWRGGIDEHAAPGLGCSQQPIGLAQLLMEGTRFRLEPVGGALAAPLARALQSDFGGHVENQSEIRFEIANGHALERPDEFRVAHAERLGNSAEQDVADHFGSGRAAGLAREHDRNAELLEPIGEKARVVRLAGALPAFESDETSAHDSDDVRSLGGAKRHPGRKSWGEPRISP